MYANGNPLQVHQTALPSKYPQGYFKEKPCRLCSTPSLPNAPSHLYCSQQCADLAHSNGYLRRTYGMTVQQYAQLYVKQGGRCAICGGEGFLLNKTRHKIKLVVDHDHSTGKIRGLLCHNCNRALGLFHDNLDHLNNALNYLKVQRPS